MGVVGLCGSLDGRTQPCHETSQGSRLADANESDAPSAEPIAVRIERQLGI